MLVTDEHEPFYSRPGLSYLLRGDISEVQLRIRKPEEVRALKTTFVRGRAVGLDPGEHEVELADGRRLHYDRLLLATGAEAARPDLAGAGLDGVVTLGSFADARDLLERVRRGGRAVVSGVGPGALDLVEGFRCRGLDTHLALPGIGLWPGVLDEAESSLLQARLQAQRVTIHQNAHVRRAVGTGGRLEAVETAQGENVPCRIFAVALGVVPRAELGRGAGLATARGILVDERLRTSVPDVWAAGDVVERTDPVSRRPVLDTLWTSALAQGEAAGLDMAGAGAPFVPQGILNVVRPAGLSTTIVGMVGTKTEEHVAPLGWGDAEIFHLRADGRTIASQTASGRTRVVLTERRIVGAVVLADSLAARTLARAIARGRDIGRVRATLSTDPDNAIEQLLAACEERGPSAGERVRPDP